jgi:Fe-Mn family superoxide dismutase
MTFILPPLPYATDALAPLMSVETLKFHHGKHHKGYVDTVNALAEPAGFANMPLDAIVRGATGPLFNAAAQHWNHSFFWNCLRPESAAGPTGALAKHIDNDFGGFAAFQHAFTQMATSHFGSGWVWLVRAKTGALEIRATHDAATPLTDIGVTPLLTVDVWEHAYYLDHRNARADYLGAFWRLANWDFAEKHFG